MKKILLPTVFALILCACDCKRSIPYAVEQAQLDELIAHSSIDFPAIKIPQFADRQLNIIDLGADPSGQQLSTAAFQQAIDFITAQGGGTVLVPHGVYVTGPIELKSNVRLLTEKNAIVVFSDDFTLYPIHDTSFEGLDTKRCQSPLSANGAENVAICGEGVFNGSGDSWRPLKKSKVTGNQWKQQCKRGVLSADGKVWYPDSAAIIAHAYCEDQNVPVNVPDSLWESFRSFLRPVMLSFVNCKNVYLQGVTFENSPAWNLHPLMCENVILQDLTVRNPWYSQNGDGVDIESCKNVIITGCSFDVGDDAICMKSGKNEDGRRRGIPTDNVIVDDCVVYHGHGGFVVGSEMSGDVRNIEVSNCSFLGTDVGLRFKSTRGRGGIVENIFIKDIYMIDIPNEALLFDLFYGGKGAGEETEEEIAARMAAAVPEVTIETPQFQNITITDVICKGAKRAMYFNGLPEMKIKNVSLNNITMESEIGAVIQQTDGLTIENVKIIPTVGEPIIMRYVDNVVQK